MRENSTMSYIGNELEIFAHAKNWKDYWAQISSKFYSGRVLEVGAGIGTNTKYLLPLFKNIKSWKCIEPDRSLLDILDNLEFNDAHIFPEKECGTIKELNSEKNFDTILYIDVIEHIYDDQKELAMAFDRLIPGGNLIILVPAHNYLYSEFDKEIGHYRRYNKSMLLDILPAGYNVKVLKYLDSLGFFLSLANKIFLKQSKPSLSQILFWDKYIVPISKILDPILGFNFGKSVLLVATKKNRS